MKFLLENSRNQVGLKKVGAKMKKQQRCGVVSTASALPEKVLTNHQLERMVDTDNHWIVSRTGIQERRIAQEGLGASHYSMQASRKALEKAALSPQELDLIIIATVTPDQPLPATANVIQDRLGAHKAAAFDLSAGCSGFVYGLSVGQQFIETGMYRNVLVVGVDLLSRIVDWQDRSTCVLFGDGAGAVVLQPVEDNRGILSTSLGSVGSGADMLQVPAGGALMPPSEETVKNRLHYVKMNGNEVFKFAVRVVGEVTEELLAGADKKVNDLDMLLLHQANLRIMEAARKRLGITPARTPTNIESYGNMSAASIPVILDEVNQEGRLHKGDLVAMVAFGAGLSWGGALLRW